MNFHHYPGFLETVPESLDPTELTAKLITWRDIQQKSSNSQVRYFFFQFIYEKKNNFSSSNKAGIFQGRKNFIPQVRG